MFKKRINSMVTIANPHRWLAQLWGAVLAVSLVFTLMPVNAFAAEMEETVHIHTAKAAYDALSTGERETMAPEAKEKLLALYDFALRIPTAAPLSESSAVVELNGKKYNSLQAAINALDKNFYTIHLLASVDASVTVTTNYDFRLNLNGNTLSNSTSDSIIKHAGGGMITIINEKDEGGTIITNADGGNAILIRNGDIAVNNGVNIRATGTSSTAIICEAGASVQNQEGAEISATGESGIAISNNNGSIWIDGGKVSATGKSGIAISNNNGIVSLDNYSSVEAFGERGCAIKSYGGQITVKGDASLSNNNSYEESGTIYYPVHRERYGYEQCKQRLSTAAEMVARLPETHTSMSPAAR